MIRSMTGFGRSEAVAGKRKVIVEIKAVNHRYCDMNIRMPKKLGSFEAAVRSIIKGYLSRGKVDVFITYEDFTENSFCVRYHREIAAGYVDSIRQIQHDFGSVLEKTWNGEDIGLDAVQLSRYPEVLVLEEQTVDEEELWNFLEGAVREACEKFVEARAREGEHLREDLLGKLDHMAGLVELVERRYPAMMADYQKKLYEKVQELLGEAAVDEARIAAEVVIYGDKICVDEEVVRLRSHIEHMRQTLLEGGSVGRKLDFIAQEMNRESNTILSKANDLEISNVAIDLKTEIERIREQIQNLE